MVIPAVGIVIHNDYRSALPVALLLQEIDEVNEEGLFIERVGVPGVSVLERLRLNKAYSREVARANGSVKILQVVFVVGGAGVPDFGNRCRPRVLRVSCRRVVLEERMVRDVVGGSPGQTGRASMA